MVLVSSLGPDVTMALVGSAGHSNQHGLSGNVGLKHPQDPRCGPRSWHLHSIQCQQDRWMSAKTLDPEEPQTQIWPIHILGLDNNTMAPGGSISHPVSNGPVDRLTLKDQQGLRCQPKLWASAQPSVAMGDMGVNSEPS